MTKSQCTGRKVWWRIGTPERRGLFGIYLLDFFFVFLITFNFQSQFGSDETPKLLQVKMIALVF